MKSGLSEMSGSVFVFSEVYTWVVEMSKIVTQLLKAYVLRKWPVWKWNEKGCLELALMVERGLLRETEF